MRDFGELEEESDLPCNSGCRLNRPWAFGSASQDGFYPSRPRHGIIWGAEEVPPLHHQSTAAALRRSS